MTRQNQSPTDALMEAIRPLIEATILQEVSKVSAGPLGSANIRTGADMPLFADTTQAVKLFGMCKQTLVRLRREYPDFPARQMNSDGKVYYDVPRCYAWFARHIGTDVADGLG